MVIILISLFSVTTKASPATIEYSVIAPLASQSLLLDGVTVENRLIAVGERGHILVAEDSSRSWVQSKVPTQATLTGVYFHDKNLGWAVGHDAVILRTTDGGKQWTRVHYAPQEEAPLFDVWFKDANTGFAVGAYGLLLVTSDRGVTWSREKLNVVKDNPGQNLGQSDSNDHGGKVIEDDNDFHLNSIAKAENGQLYIAAEAGRLYRSDDNGRNWISLSSPYHGSFFGVLPLESNALLVYGLRGNLFRSEDGGRAWRPIATFTNELLTDGLRVASNTVIIVGLGGTVLVSQDNGRSFIPRQQPGRRGYSAILQTANGELIVLGEAGLHSLPSNIVLPE